MASRKSSTNFYYTCIIWWAKKKKKVHRMVRTHFHSAFWLETKKACDKGQSLLTRTKTKLNHISCESPIASICRCSQKKKKTTQIANLYVNCLYWFEEKTEWFSYKVFGIESIRFVSRFFFFLFSCYTDSLKVHALSTCI